MDFLPKDLAILVSSVNMLLRDEEFDTQLPASETERLYPFLYQRYIIFLYFFGCWGMPSREVETLIIVFPE